MVTPERPLFKGATMKALSKVLVWLMLGGLALFYLPFALGIGWSVVGVPLYGMECGKWQDIANGIVSADTFRGFLTNHGCILDDEIRQVISKQLPERVADSDKIIAIIKGQQSPQNADEVLERDIVRNELREFRPIIARGTFNRESDAGKPDCPERPVQSQNSIEDEARRTLNRSLCKVDATYRGQHSWYSDDVVGRFFSYATSTIGSHVSRGITEGLNDGADFITGLASTGPVARALLLATFTALFALPLGTILMVLLKKLFGSTSKDAG